MTESSSPSVRRRQRRNWPVRRFRLGHEPGDDLSHLTPAERVALVGELTLRAWRLAGKALPDLPRSRWPGRLRRLRR